MTWNIEKQVFFILIRHEIHKYTYNDNETHFYYHISWEAYNSTTFLHSSLRKVTIKMGLENYAYLRADSHKKVLPLKTKGKFITQSFSIKRRSKSA